MSNEGSLKARKSPKFPESGIGIRLPIDAVILDNNLFATGRSNADWDLDGRLVGYKCSMCPLANWSVPASDNSAQAWSALQAHVREKHKLWGQKPEGLRPTLYRVYMIFPGLAKPDPASKY